MSGGLLFAQHLVEQGVRETLVARCDGTIAVLGVHLADGRRLIALERTYREGICVIVDATDEELEIARNGDLWSLWNSERCSDGW